MERPTRTKARLTLAIVAALSAASAVTPALAGSAPLATDEYLLEFPGVQGTDNPPVAPETPGAPADGTQMGVVGEEITPESPIDAFLSSIGSASPALLLGIGALLTVVILVAASLQTRHVRAAR